MLQSQAPPLTKTDVSDVTITCVLKFKGFSSVWYNVDRITPLPRVCFIYFLTTPFFGVLVDNSLFGVDTRGAGQPPISSNRHLQWTGHAGQGTCPEPTGALQGVEARYALQCHRCTLGTINRLALSEWTHSHRTTAVILSFPTLNTKSSARILPLALYWSLVTPVGRCRASTVTLSPLNSDKLPWASAPLSP